MQSVGFKYDFLLVTHCLVVSYNFWSARMKYSVARAKLAVFKHAFSSLHAFMKAVEVEPYVDDEGRVNRWRNEGMFFDLER